MDIINLDYESRSEEDLIASGLDRYANHDSTEIVMAAWSINGEAIEQWDLRERARPPSILIDALRDPNVQKWAYNAQFERVMTEKCWGIESDYANWRCTQVLAYMMGFAGTLDNVGRAMKLAADKRKMAEGKKLIQLFCRPQKITTNQPHQWRDWRTDPDRWDEFLQYNRQDVVTEMDMKSKLIRYPVPESEWRLYAVDQRINDRGVAINLDHARQALAMADVRKEVRKRQVNKMTGLANANSTTQLLPWAKARGYPFDDLRKDSVQKVIREAEAGEIEVQKILLQALKKRLDANKTSLSKYATMLKAVGKDGRFRYSMQFVGAQRTGRWAGRRIQVQNLPRTPKTLEDVHMLAQANFLITKGDLVGLQLFNGEPIHTLVGTIRSAFVPAPGKKFVVADLASIESVVIGWLTDCRWFMDNLRSGRDLYRAFAAEWLHIPYDETKPHRGKAKPATLGAGFRLGGGTLLPNGKKTGLWAYGENMGVFMTKEEAHSSVQAVRSLCPEIVKSWYALEKAVAECMRTKQPTKVVRESVDGEKEAFTLPITIEYRKPFLCIVLPSGRRLYYHDPKMVRKTNKRTDGSTYQTVNFTYMGKPQNKQGWERLESHGGKLIENIVQAIARDILKLGLMRVDKFGSDPDHIAWLVETVMHIHDEMVTEVDEDADDEQVMNFVKKCLTKPVPWAPGLPLGAAGYVGTFYRKD